MKAYRYDERCRKCALKETGDCLMLDEKMHFCPVWYKRDKV